MIVVMEIVTETCGAVVEAFHLAADFRNTLSEEVCGRWRHCGTEIAKNPVTARIRGPYGDFSAGSDVGFRRS